MRQNTGMYENVRVFFSILWLIAFGAAFATGFAVIISWGGFLEYFIASLIVLGVATAGVIITSL
jgi:hypothetical protein